MDYACYQCGAVFQECQEVIDDAEALDIGILCDACTEAERLKYCNEGE